MSHSIPEMLERQMQAIGLVPTRDTLMACDFLLKELYRWNPAINLTAVKSIRDAVEKHITDSLALLPFLLDTEILMDAGSGAGFPGIPIKICRPDITVFSVEASRKKVYFQREIVRKLKLQNFFPLPVRLENLHNHYPDFPSVDVVVSRALGHAADLARMTARFLTPRGRLIVMKSSIGDQETLDWRAKDSGLVLEKIHELTLPESGATRKILVFKKVLSF